VALAATWLKLDSWEASAAEAELWTALTELLADATREETPATAELAAIWMEERAEAGAPRADEAWFRREETPGMFPAREGRMEAIWALEPAARAMTATAEKRMLKVLLVELVGFVEVLLLRLEVSVP
jgi:hypothetical protein